MENLNFSDFIDHLEVLDFKKGDIVLKQGSVTNEKIYFLFVGELVVEKNRNEMNIEISLIKAGEFFGEISVVTSKPRSATVVVRSDKAKVGLIDKSTFLLISKKEPKFLFVLLRQAIHTMHRAESKLNKLLKNKEELSPGLLS